MSNENKLSPVTVYVPVKMEDRLPETGLEFMFRKEGDAYWLKEQSKYVFNREELQKFIFDTLNDFDKKYNYIPGMKLVAERKEYIQSLF